MFKRIIISIFVFSAMAIDGMIPASLNKDHPVNYQILDEGFSISVKLLNKTMIQSIKSGIKSAVSDYIYCGYFSAKIFCLKTDSLVQIADCPKYINKQIYYITDLSPPNV